MNIYARSIILDSCIYVYIYMNISVRENEYSQRVYDSSLGESFFPYQK